MKTFHILRLSLLFVLGALSASAQSHPCMTALSEIQAGRPSDAILTSNSALKESKNFCGYFTRALAYGKQKNYLQADTDYGTYWEKHQEFVSNYPEASKEALVRPWIQLVNTHDDLIRVYIPPLHYYYLGQKTTNSEQALNFFRLAVGEFPEFWQAWKQIGHHLDKISYVKSPEAIEAYNTAIRYKSDCCYLERGALHLSYSDNDLAIADFRAAAAQEGTRPLAVAYLWRLKDPAAKPEPGLAYDACKVDLECLERLAQYAPDFPPVYLKLGERYENKGRKLDAANSYSKYASLYKPQDRSGRTHVAELYLMIGKLFWSVDERQKAMNAYSSAVAMAPDSDLRFEALETRASAHLILKDYPKAAADASAALELSEYIENPDLTRIFVVLTSAHLGMYFDSKSEADLNKAEASVKQCLESYPKHKPCLEFSEMVSRHRNTSGLASLRRKAFDSLEKNDFDSAIRDFRAMIELDPKADAGHYGLGAALAGKKEWAPAIKAYTTAIELNPKFADYYYVRAVAYADTDDATRALTDLNEAIRLDAKQVDFYSLRGYILLDLKRLDDAIADYDKALNLKPNAQGVHNSRAWANYLAGRYLKALPDAHKAIELDPQDRHAYDTRGNIYWKLNRLNEARADFRKVLELDPDNKAAKDALEKLAAP